MAVTYRRASGGALQNPAYRLADIYERGAWRKTPGPSPVLRQNSWQPGAAPHHDRPHRHRRRYPELALLNAALIRDEGHRNTMTVPQLEARMRKFFDQEAMSRSLFGDDGRTAGYALWRQSMTTASICGSSSSPSTPGAGGLAAKRCSGFAPTPGRIPSASSCRCCSITSAASTSGARRICDYCITWSGGRWCDRSPDDIGGLQAAVLKNADASHRLCAIRVRASRISLASSGLRRCLPHPFTKYGTM